MTEAKTFSREELYRLVWSRPTIDLAKELGISDVGLGKICRRMNVPKPPPGYWARIASGHKVKTPPLPALNNGQQSEVEIWPSTPKSNLQPRNPNVVELVERENLMDNRIVVSDNLHCAHKLVSYTSKVLSKEKPDSYGRLMLPWNFRWDRPVLDLRVSKQALHRALRIMDALIKAMEKRGYQVENNSTPHYASGNCDVEAADIFGEERTATLLH